MVSLNSLEAVFKLAGPRFAVLLQRTLQSRSKGFYGVLGMLSKQSGDVLNRSQPSLILFFNCPGGVFNLFPQLKAGVLCLSLDLVRPCAE